MIDGREQGSRAPGGGRWLRRRHTRVRDEREADGRPILAPLLARISLGRDKGLPTAVSGHNSQWWWGPGNPHATTIVAVAPGTVADYPGYLARFFTEVVEVTTLTNPHGARNIESGGHVYLCTGPRRPWSQLWPQLRHYN